MKQDVLLVKMIKCQKRRTQKGRESCVTYIVMRVNSFQLEALDARCDGGLEGPEGRLLEVFVDKLTK